MNRKTYKITELPSQNQKYIGQALNNPLYTECIEIRRKFLETSMHEPDHFTWRIINDYIACTRIGWVVTKQVRKAREAIIKYGSDSTFWAELERTKKLRNIQTNRLANVIRIACEMMDKGGLTREIRRELSGFKGISIDFRKKLMVKPFSEKQLAVLYKMERICGVYYSDLSAKENGEIWEGFESE